MDLDPIVIERQVLKLIPEKVALEQLVLPIGVEERNLLLGMVNPMDQQVIEEVSFATGLSVRPHICLHEQLHQTIVKAYASDDETYQGPFAPGVDATIQIEETFAFTPSLRTMTNTKTPSSSRFKTRLRKASTSAPAFWWLKMTPRSSISL